MNERIKTLFIQAGGGVEEENGNLWTYSDDLDPEKFAQLIVGECASVCENSNYEFGTIFTKMIKEHFGVEE